MAEVFLDTFYAIALSAPGDVHHARALWLSHELDEAGTRLVTTRAVLLEIGNTLSKQRYRHIAVALLQLLEDDPNVQIVPLTEGLYHQAFTLFRERPDKEWSLIDCVSCVVMQERGITEVLTADEHFRQMGFQILLK